MQKYIICFVEMLHNVHRVSPCNFIVENTLTTAPLDIIYTKISPGVFFVADPVLFSGKHGIASNYKSGLFSLINNNIKKCLVNQSETPPVLDTENS